MERLTDHHVDGNGSYMICSGTCEDIDNCAECEKLASIVDRLAAYEDTGLAPETVAEADKTLKVNWNIPLARLKEAIDFIKAKDEGRLAVDIVHCRDCKHLYFKDMSRYCPYRVGSCWPNGFCDRGERRKDKTT